MDSTEKEKILVIDDDKDICYLLSLLLTNSGYDVTQAFNGVEGLEIAKIIKPDLVITDIEMPGLDGYQFCAELQKIAETPVIFLSAKQQAQDKIKGLNLGGIDYVTKPFESQEMIARVQSQLRIRSLSQKLLKANKELILKQNKLEDDLKAAAEIQAFLLPHSTSSSISNVDVGWKFVPSENIGGDIFNIFPLNKSTFVMYMVDVSGHGVPAALIAVAVSQLLQNQRLSNSALLSTPINVVQELDNNFSFDLLRKYFTMIYVTIDSENGVMKYCNAAHPPGLLIRKNKELILLTPGGSLVGLNHIVPFQESSVQLQSGDRLILYTDGLTESMNIKNIQFGHEHLQKFCVECKDQSIDDFLETLMEKLHSHHEGKFSDDIAVLAMDYH
ncbi:MAG: SpoIIE family protein phosphatase [Parachlamydiales bacterium]|nr:SpoIIE family protein phosphatase [Parachlamydiales bacterium]